MNFQSTEMSSYNEKKKVSETNNNNKITDVDKLYLIILTPFDASMGRKLHKKNVLVGRQESCVREGSQEHKMFSHQKKFFTGSTSKDRCKITQGTGK